MSEQVVVRCPSCSQKYRVPPSSVGHHARCRKCQIRFLVAADPAIDDDTVFAWITGDDPSASSVMGSTGMFQPSAVPGRSGLAEDEEEEASSESRRPSAGVKLVRIDSEGALFEFPSAALADEQLRNSFPRKCAGCGTRTALQVHLVYWRDRMPANDALTWQARQDAPMGKLVSFNRAFEVELLKQLPSARGLPSPFNLPFPVFTCEHCRPSREVRGRVAMQSDREVCRLSIMSLAIAVDFFRDNGGRHTPEYHRLIEERDQHPDAWRGLEGHIRQRIQQWFIPKEDERFVGFFRDAEFAPQEAGASGMVLTNRRLVFKKYAACREYQLTGAGRIEIIPQGGHAAIHIYEKGGRPAIVKMEPASAEDLAGSLRRLRCKWMVVSR